MTDAAAARALAYLTALCERQGELPLSSRIPVMHAYTALNDVQPAPVMVPAPVTAQSIEALLADTRTAVLAATYGSRGLPTVLAATEALALLSSVVAES